ncbi:MAG TPA: hypothetical protein VK698_23985 [Kofleriaceae bacterium]|nr:hypothetical protein [Kofleriaceae bacterium]
MSIYRLMPGAVLGSLLSIGMAAGCAKEASESAPAAAPQPEATQVAPSPRPLPTLDSPASPASPAPSARAGDPDHRRRGGRGGRRGQMLERFDQNGDGQLDDAERAAMTHDRAAKMIERNDTDKDGALSVAELDAIKGNGRRFQRVPSDADANKDGSITAAELEASMVARMQQRRAGGAAGERGDEGAADGEGEPPAEKL